MTHTIARLVAAVALLALPLTAFGLDDCKFSAERKGGIDTAGAERVEILARRSRATPALLRPLFAECNLPRPARIQPPSPFDAG